MATKCGGGEQPGVPIAEDSTTCSSASYQVDAARSNSEANHGLGLSIVKAVASMHGGSVFVDNADGWNTFGFTVLSPERRGSGDPLAAGRGRSGTVPERALGRRAAGGSSGGGYRC